MRRRSSDNARVSGFSLVEVLVAVVILGVTGLALIDGLKSNVLQVQRVDARASSAVALAAAVENLKAAPYVSCAESATPYDAAHLAPYGLALPSGINVVVQEFLTTTTTPWQACTAVRSAGTAGAVQYIALTAADGTSRTLMHFAQRTPTPTATPTATPTPTPTPSLGATVTTDPKSACATFSKSSTSKPCLITITNAGGSGTTWRVTAITFAGGAFLNPAPTVSVAQSTPIVISTYTLDGGRSCPDKTTPVMTITLTDDGNGTTTNASPVITC